VGREIARRRDGGSWQKSAVGTFAKRGRGDWETSWKKKKSVGVWGGVLAKGVDEKERRAIHSLKERGNRKHIRRGGESYLRSWGLSDDGGGSMNRRSR